MKKENCEVCSDRYELFNRVNVMACGTSKNPCIRSTKSDRPNQFYLGYPVALPQNLFLVNRKKGHKCLKSSLVVGG
ncbi:MAG: hypothetical protein AAGJ08_16205 [Cyanobacteria bacterium P01_H01_bin.35]